MLCLDRNKPSANGCTGEAKDEEAIISADSCCLAVSDWAGVITSPAVELFQVSGQVYAVFLANESSSIVSIVEQAVFRPFTLTDFEKDTYTPFLRRAWSCGSQNTSLHQSGMRHSYSPFADAVTRDRNKRITIAYVTSCAFFYASHHGSPSLVVLNEDGRKKLGLYKTASLSIMAITQSSQSTASKQEAVSR